MRHLDVALTTLLVIAFLVFAVRAHSDGNDALAIGFVIVASLMIVERRLAKIERRLRDGV